MGHNTLFVFFVFVFVFFDNLRTSIAKEKENNHNGRSGLPWVIWRQRNDLVFNDMQWPFEKTSEVIWDAL